LVVVDQAEKLGIEVAAAVLVVIKQDHLQLTLIPHHILLQLVKVVGTLDKDHKDLM
jgi:hypothetical protein